MLPPIALQCATLEPSSIEQIRPACKRARPRLAPLVRDMRWCDKVRAFRSGTRPKGKVRMVRLRLSLALAGLAASSLGGALAEGALAFAGKEPNKLVAHRAIYEM